MRDKEQDRTKTSIASFWLIAMFLVAAIVLPAAPAAAQWIPCLGATGDTTQPPIYLPRIPELGFGADGKLQATMLLVSEKERMSFRNPIANQQGAANTGVLCAPQYVRAFKGVGALPPPPDNGTQYPDPMPGPTIRAQVGNMVELTFINQINPLNFPDSIDRGDYQTGSGCDETTVPYPGGDKYPNCFHGSSTANIHFHGTHTSPSSTADNVFIEIRPSPRKDGKPTVTEDTFKDAFKTFYGNCEAILGKNPLIQWPKVWSDLPKAYTDGQYTLITEYDKTPNIKPLWPVNQRQIDHGYWPQYYVGAYPYCFRLPEYKGTSFPPTESAAVAHTPQSHGAGTAEQQATHTGEESDAGPNRPIMMGQAPGTHWYHAHKHGSTAIDVYNGMTGAFIIEGDYDKQLDGFYGAGWTRKQPVMVINQIGDAPNLERTGPGRQGRGPDFFVNGRANPTVRMKPGEVQLWRILNTSARAGVYFPAVTPVSPPDPAADFVRMQLAQDGVQFNAANYALFKNQDLVLASGNRADFLVKAPTKKGSYQTIVRNVVNTGQNTSGNPIKLFTVVVADDPVGPPLSDLLPTDPAKFPLTFPPFLTDITPAEVNGTRKMVFATTGAGSTTTGQSLHTIDGKQFNGEVGEVVLLNRVEEWQIFNQTTNIEHPFHIHINPFQVTEVLDVSVKLPAMTGTGTIAFTSGSKTVTGTGTSFGKQILVGYTITAGGTTGTVASIQSETSLTLSANAGASASGNVTFVAPKYVGDKAALNVQGQCYIDPFAPLEPAVYFPDPAHPDVPKLCGGETRVPPPRIWWDVFPMPLGTAATKADGTAIKDPKTNLPIVLPGYFKMRSRFVDFPGYFVIHCHILAHEDRGMMTVVEVAPLSSPYSHH
ncbi:MAG: hypothetical protein QOK37_1871 [Thermoanaerobaculia bacterium]|jgi:FtsP/CotA-like multicopper oxidase with cupredoxin domain|nr:hypothetical protein [Thermoanaerobaculia bacterium]